MAQIKNIGSEKTTPSGDDWHHGQDGSSDDSFHQKQRNSMAGYVPVHTDANRPAAGNQGRVIFNADDGQLNIDDGANWTLPDGTTT